VNAPFDGRNASRSGVRLREKRVRKSNIVRI
jgi:hypothetical protein